MLAMGGKQRGRECKETSEARRHDPSALTRHNRICYGASLYTYSSLGYMEDAVSTQCVKQIRSACILSATPVLGLAH